MVLYRGRGGWLAEGDATTTDLDIYRSAKLLIDQHGDSAAIEAAMKADAMLDKGDLDGAAVWRQIVAAINKMERAEPRPGERQH